MKEFRLVNSEYLWAYLLIPVCIILFFVAWQWRKKAIKRFGEWQVISPLFENVSVAKPVTKFVLMLVALAALILAVARPQLGSRLEEVKRKGIDVMICLDVSNSMNAEDIKPNRLERSKQAIMRLIDELDGDRIGIIVFAGKAYTQLPITTDYGAAKLFLSTISTDMIPLQGTAIGSAIELATESFGDSVKQHNSAIVVITDGENHEDDAIEAAKAAIEKGITVHTIGMGTEQGAPIPVIDNGKRIAFMQDEEGQTVMTKLDESLLVQIAAAGGGKFVRATTSDDGLSLIKREIDKMEGKEFSTKLFTSYEEQFQWVIGFALVLIIVEFLISERKSIWLRKLNLFNEKKQ